MAGSSKKAGSGSSNVVKRGKRKAEDGDGKDRNSKKAKNQPKPNYSTFADLPLDVLPNICQNLTSEDLVNLCDASPILRNNLSRLSQRSLWKCLRENEGVYEIPDGMNEYYWAKLLFSSRCMECNAENVLKADFYLRRRICKNCKKTKCITGSYGSPDDEESCIVDAFECSPHSNLTADGSSALYNRVWWRADVKEQNQKLAALINDVELDKPEATRVLMEYKMARRKLLRTIRAEFDDFTSYQDKYLAKKKEEREDLFQPRYEEVEKRFLDLGYLKKDFPRNMKMHKLVRSKANLTDRAWNNIRDALEPVIQAARDSRERKEWIKLKFERREILDKAYASHKFNNVAHLLWKYLPQTHTLATLQPFDELITCSKDRELTEADFAPAFKMQLDQTVASAFEEAKIRLRGQVLSAQDPFLSPLESTKELQDLKLAAIVWRCQHCQYLVFGFDDVRSHHCARATYALERYRRDEDPKPFSDEFPFNLKFEKGAANVVRAVIETMGLDPKTVTPEQLDEKNTRFRCECESKKTRGMTAYKWFEWVAHIFDHHKYQVDNPDHLKLPEIMPDAYMDQILAKELDQLSSYCNGRNYACLHCATYCESGNLSRYDSMSSHLQHEHNILDAQVNVDLIDMSGKRIAGAGYGFGVEVW